MGLPQPAGSFGVFLVNTLTNPVVTALRYLSGQTVPSEALRTVILVVLEIAVLLSEWKLFEKFLSKGRHFFLFSLLLNAASFGAGLLVPLLLQHMRAGHINAGIPDTGPAYLNCPMQEYL